jgi:hypothetical protein
LQISFQDDGAISGDLMDLDVLYPFSGTYNKNSNNLILNIDFYSQKITDTCNFRVINNDTLKLIKEIDYNNHDTYYSIPQTIINKLYYESVFLKNKN